MSRLGPLSQIALGFILGFATLGFAACATLPPALECRLGTLRVLPEDPDQITVGDLRDVVGRLKACATPDGGK